MIINSQEDLFVGHVLDVNPYYLYNNAVNKLYYIDFIRFK